MWDAVKLKKALKDNFLESKINISCAAKEVIIDSRQKTNNGLFIALIGENNDGHNYLKQAFNNGAIGAIVQKIPEQFKKDSRLILVKDTNKSLIDLANYSRSIFKGTIIGVTGSVGKTSIKEMLKSILSSKNKVFANYGNLNNHFGLPLSLCNLPENYDYGILEMGMNNLGEINFLSKIAKPNIAIISSVVAAHIGNFKNEQEIALAKSEIFNGLTNNGHIILNKDNKHYDFLISQALKNNIKQSNIISFGKNKDSNILLESFNAISPTASQVNISINQKKIGYTINNINEATIINSLVSIGVLTALKENIDNYLPSFNKLTTPKGRGNIIKTTHNNISLTIIDDSYNANLTSVIAGLKFLSNLKEQNPNSRTIAIIGDMLELGDKAIIEHKSIAKYIDQFNIDKVLLVGKLTKNIIPQLKKEKFISHFENSSNLANNINNIVKNNDILLIKGSRGTKMEVIIDNLKHA